MGLEIGADDYVTKPFDPRELLARIKSVMRRLQASAPAASSNTIESQGIAVGRCRLDVASRQLFDGDGHEVPITTMEYDLLKVFLDHPKKVLTRDQILTLTHNREWEPFDRSIDIRIARLRRKVESDPDKPQAIRTVRGAGYMFVPGPQPSARQSASDVMTPMNVIAGKPCAISSFTQHLNALCEDKRGPALQRIGAPRAYKYKFKDAILRPYVIMKGLESGLISEERMTQLAAEKVVPFSA